MTSYVYIYIYLFIYTHHIAAIPGVLAYEVMQDFYHQQYPGPTAPSPKQGRNKP